MRELGTLLTAVILTAGLLGAPETARAAVPPPVGTLAPTPPMGFNNWNAFGCDVSEKLIRETADVVARSDVFHTDGEHVYVDNVGAE